MERLAASDYIKELQRLHGDLEKAMQAKDADGIEHAEHAMTLFFRYMSQGRIQEYFARQEQG